MSDIEGSERDWRLAATVAVTRCGQITSFKSGKGLQLLSCSLDSWLQDKLQDTTTVQRRRFFAVPRHAGKDYWQVERHPKIVAAPVLFRKSWNKNTPAQLYIDECNRS